MADDPLKKKADQPKSAEVDGQKVEQHSLKNQIEMDRYLASKKAIRSGRGFALSGTAVGGGGYAHRYPPYFVFCQ